MAKIYKHLLLFLIVFSVCNSYAQEKNKVLPLKKILATISRQHKVQFNFIEEEVSEIKLVPPIITLELTEKLQYLSTETSLDFEIISSKYVIISSKKHQIITKDSIPIDLGEILIGRYLAKGISKTIEGNLVVKPKKFGILPGLVEPDVLQAMQQIPGIYSADETISTINVRSGTHDQNLFLWNGIRMFQTGHFFGLISAFNPSLTQKIVISKNGTSAFYGESVSSVVDISSLSEKIENTNSGVSSNLISSEFNTNIKLSEKASFQISGRRSFTDFATSPTYKNYYNRVFQNTIISTIGSNETINFNSDEDFYFYDFTTQYHQEINSKIEFTAAVIGINNSLDLQQNKISDTNFESRDSHLKQRNFGGNFSLKTIWNENNFSKINGYVSYYNLDSKNEAIENNQILEQQNKVLDMGFRIENKHLLNSNLLLNTGYQYNEIGITNYEKINNPQFSKRVKEVLRSHALVLESEYHSKNKRLFLKTGLRSNYIEEFSEFIFEPRLQLNYALLENLNLEILGEQKNQTTSQIIDQQQDFLGIEKRRWTLSDNSSIPIQKSNQISVGFTYKNKNWLVVLDNFYKKVTGISTPSQAFQNQLEFKKINGDYTVFGSEILLQKNFNHFYTWLSYSLSNSEYKFNSLIPSEFANNFQIVHSISWAGIYEWKNLKIALGSKWHSGRPETTPATNLLNFDNPAKPEINYNFPNNKDLSDYFQMNFSASYDWDFNSETQLELGISVLNVLNKKNIINRYYRVNNDNNTIESVNTYSLERTPNVSLKLHF